MLGFAVLLAMVSGCVYPDMHVTRLTPGPAAPTGKPSKIYEVGDKVERPYEVIGVVSASGQHGGVQTWAKKKMLAEAATLGADALVGYYYDDETSTMIAGVDGWAGALAVRFLPSGAVAAAPSKAVIALPHVFTAKDLGTGNKAEKADAIARKHARYLLAMKGYYAVLVNDHLAPGFPDSLTSLSPTDRLKYGSPDADLVLAITLGERKAFNAFLVVASSQALGTALYAKSSNSVTWQNAGGGDSSQFVGVAGGIAHIFVPSSKNTPAVHEALKAAFDTLPDLTSPPDQR